MAENVPNMMKSNYLQIQAQQSPINIRALQRYNKTVDTKDRKNLETSWKNNKENNKLTCIGVQQHN